MKVAGFAENQSYNHLPAIFTTMDQWRTIHFAAPGSDMGVDSPVNAIMLQGKNIIPGEITKEIDGIEIATKQEAINGIPGYKEENGTIMMMPRFFIGHIGHRYRAVFFYVLTLQKRTNLRYEGHWG